MASLLGDRLVQVQDQAGDGRVGGQLARGRALVAARSFAGAGELPSRFADRVGSAPGARSSPSRRTASSVRRRRRRAVARRKASVEPVLGRRAALAS